MNEINERLTKLEKFNQIIDIYILKIIKDSFSKLKKKNNNLNEKYNIGKYYFHTQIEDINNNFFEINNNTIKCIDNCGSIKISEIKRRNEAIFIKIEELNQDIQIGITTNYNKLPLTEKDSWSFSSNGNLFIDGKFYKKKYDSWKINDEIIILYNYFSNTLECYKNNNYCGCILNIPVNTKQFDFVIGAYKNSKLILNEYNRI